MISRDYKFIFIHIPKTGGTSIEDALGPQDRKLDHRDGFGLNKGELKDLAPFEGFSWRHHFSFSTIKYNGITKCCAERGSKIFKMTDEEYLREYGVGDERALESYFKFAFVRNPFDRFVSEYFWRKARYQDGNIGTFNGQKLPSFNDFTLNLEKYSQPREEHLFPQYKFIYEKQKLQVDFIGRFESINEDFSYACKRLGRGPLKLPHTQRTCHLNYKSYYSEKAKQSIYQRYKKDFLIFNYE